MYVRTVPVTALCKGQLNVVDGSNEDKILKGMYGKKMFDDYMAILDDPSLFLDEMVCFKSNHKKQALYLCCLCAYTSSLLQDTM